MSAPQTPPWGEAPAPLRKALEAALDGVLEAMEHLHLADFGSVQELHRATDLLWRAEDALDQWRASTAPDVTLTHPEDAA